jgi:thiol:disulfide interchange protein DsbA
VDLKMRQADSQIMAMQITGTPTLVVNGKYRVDNKGGPDEVIAVVRYLVAKESAPKSAAASAKKP